RIHDHPYVEFVHRVQNYYGQTEISAAALFNNDAKGFPNAVTVRDVLNNYPFPNTLAVVKITGAELKAAIEQSAEFFILNEDQEIVMSKDWLYPKPKPYNYDMYEGIDYIIDVSKPIGQRVTKLNYHGQPLDLEAEFEVTLNQYRAIGGGDYHMFDSSKIVREVNMEMNQLIPHYLETHQEIK
ncbi:5'-nucleotidase C-terminal domain-containing protein, partial [Aerococcus sp. L_4]